MRTTFTLDEEIAKKAQELGVNISAAARQGVMNAVQAAMAISDRLAYLEHPDHDEDDFAESRAWGPS